MCVCVYVSVRVIFLAWCTYLKPLTHSLDWSFVLQRLKNLLSTRYKTLTSALQSVCACVCVFVFVPNIMPLGFVGGCQTTLTDDNRTSGNIILAGGPGTEGKKKRQLAAE